eukprot:gnl/TRDRNA2_/TRDRNA2_84378_c0_seq1.p1 gnl/TRDRNA2_/TRDRNA2_84378_c0~~gnl/TRDRNA2_/TRDRNA2_84378_c0_seq1.p1  ORF type:complete len:447 (-),score=85.41 gnl/TRDRNA2_/TRDRNA2_84378_c0_seq1:167-1507(-)
MMSGPAMIMLLVGVSRLHAKEFGGSQEDTIDQLVERALKASVGHSADLDRSTLGKTSHLATLQRVGGRPALAGAHLRLPSHQLLAPPVGTTGASLQRLHRSVDHSAAPSSRHRLHSTTNEVDLASGAVPQTREEREAGRALYRIESYQTIVDDAGQSIVDGLNDGLKLMEVEFPAVPGEDATYKASSDVFIDNNIQFAVSCGAKIYKGTGKTVQVLLPDGPEFRRAQKEFKQTLELTDGVTLGQLDDPNDYTETLTNTLGNLFRKGGEEDDGEVTYNADVYITINLSTRDLPRVEAFVNEQAKGAAVIFFNDELDTLRGDLGAPFFPGRDMHFRFLSKIKTVYYIRPRDYSKTIAQAPFVINYSGALFREYPGPWQVMIKRQAGELVCVAEDAGRYPLGSAKKEMLKSLGLAEEEGSTMEFLRQGYKTETWWEEQNNDEESNVWRT